MSGGNVLPFFDPPREKSYRAAVAQAMRDLRAKHHLTPSALADRIGVCKKTINNAEDECNDLNPVALLRIAYEFGEEAIQPVRDLYLRRYEAPRTLAERFTEIQSELAQIAKAMEAA